MANVTYSEHRNVELRKLNADVLCDIIYILEIDNDWKKLMSLIPKDNIQSEKFEAKYNSEHIRTIEEHAKAINQKCTEVLFDEWGTSGRVRPTLSTLKEIVLKAQMFRAADEIARLLKELPPLRPSDGPPAHITINITEMFDDESNLSDYTNSNTNKLCNATTKELKSVSDMIKFTKTQSQEANNVQGINNNPTLVKYNSDLIQFSQDKQSMNIPDLSTLIAGVKSHSIPVLPDIQSGNTSSHVNDTYESSNYLSNTSNDPDILCQTSFPNIDISQGVDSVILNDNKLKNFKYNDLKSITNNFAVDLSTRPYLTGKIGSGGFGEVFVGTHTQYGLLAVKRSHNDLTKSLKIDISMRLFNTEVKFLSHFRHRNIVPILGYSIDGPVPCIVCEYIEGGSLQYNIEAKILNKTQRMFIIVGTAEGLKYLHTHDQIVENNASLSYVVGNTQKSTKNFVHGDVKSANILLTRDYVPKLCDFGLSKQYEATTMTTTPLGTSAYMAPEMLHGTVTQNGDMYSFGIVLLELLTGLNPIIHLNNGQKYNIKDYVEDNAPNDDINQLLDPEVGVWAKAGDIFKLAQQCLKYDRRSRPSIVEVCDKLYEIRDE